MSLLQILGPILGLSVLLIRLTSPHIIRLWLKPKIAVTYVLGEYEDVKPLDTVRYKTRKIKIWVHNCSRRTLRINSISYRRYCRYQNKCLIYEYLRGIGAIKQKDWCPCANVTDFQKDVDGFRNLSETDEQQVRTRFVSEGIFTLEPFNKDILPKLWKFFGCPLKLRLGKRHVIELTFQSEFSSEDAPFVLRALYRLTNPTSKHFAGNHINIKRLIINMKTEDETDTNRDETIKEMSRSNGFVFSYLPDLRSHSEILENLRKEIVSFLSIEHKAIEVPQEKVIQALEKAFGKQPGQADMQFTLPPNGKYITFSDETIKSQIKVWSHFREFSMRFLDCEQYVELGSLFMKYLFHPFELSMLMGCTTKYIMFSSHHPCLGLVLSMKSRKKFWPVIMLKQIVGEVKLSITLWKQRYYLKRGITRMIKTQNQLLRSKSN